ncbi:Iron-sulfur assembly protein IscA, chloroplastic [Vitis vinifera]|uniref:Iron-sulfur assembly protein IscA, chloroplastic n=1 Tax=Vitis vinifera TaxID=29760 RepID=A0A438F6F7_VITVI|nr:Iron-sulfur assembly protein IscA, chloroplastic [Vitis vinifera]
MILLAFLFACGTIDFLVNSTAVFASTGSACQLTLYTCFMNSYGYLQLSSLYVSAAPTTGGLMPAISLTDNALKHLNKMRSDRTEDLCLRIGVKQGGCSGMSYTMEFEDRAKTRPDDSIIEYNGFVIDYSHQRLVNYQSTFCDPKSLLFVFGMQLDFSDALIGGGFSFKNPNATQTCGCGKSFAAEM